MMCCLNCVVFAVLLNLIIPQLAGLVATPEEANHMTSPNSLSLKGKIMHMLVHHRDTPITSSLVIAVIVYCACLIGCCVPLFK